MDFKRIREMNDEELKQFFEKIKNQNRKVCINCGEEASRVVKIENLESLQTKKLCSYCNTCYSNLLNKLEIIDIEWQV